MGLVLDSNGKRDVGRYQVSAKGESAGQVEAEFSINRAYIADKVSVALRHQSSISYTSLETVVIQLKLSDDHFYRYFDSISDLDCEIRRRNWKAFLSKLRMVAIDSSGMDAVLNIAKAYHGYVDENRSIFEYVICSSRHSHDGAKYFAKLGYLMRMVLLSCQIDIHKCEKMANNIIDVIHGIALLKLEGVDKVLSWESTDELLQRYIHKIFEESCLMTA